MILAHREFLKLGQQLYNSIDPGDHWRNGAELTRDIMVRLAPSFYLAVISSAIFDKHRSITIQVEADNEFGSIGLMIYRTDFMDRLIAEEQARECA